MSYFETKEKIRNQAIAFQCEFNQRSYFWSELALIQDYFEVQGRRYGLLKEFRENGII